MQSKLGINLDSERNVVAKIKKKSKKAKFRVSKQTCWEWKRRHEGGRLRFLPNGFDEMIRENREEFSKIAKRKSRADDRNDVRLLNVDVVSDLAPVI